MLVSTNVFCDPRRGCNTWTPVHIPLGNYMLPFVCPGCRGLSLIPIKTVRQTVFAYGDESKFGKVIAYGVVIVAARDLLAAERLLSNLTRRYGLDPRAEFHCREVFHEHPKSKSAWRNLPESQVLGFAEELLLGLKRLSAVFFLSAIHRDEYPEVLPAVGKFAAGEMGTKQLAGVLCQTALMNVDESFGKDEIKFYADRDSVKIPFFGRKIQAHSNYRLDAGETSIVSERFNDSDKPALLQAADLFAYTVTHALTESPTKNKRRFERWYKICNPRTNFWGVSDESVYALQDPVQEIEGFEPAPSRLETRHRALVTA